MATPGHASVPQHRWRDIDPGAAESSSAIGVSIVLDGDPAGAATTTEALADGVVEVLAPGEDRVPAGDVVVVARAGTLPGPGFAAAHARWHAARTGIVSLGPLGRDDADPLGLVCDLTRDLTDLGGGLHLAAGEGTIGMRRELYEEVGGRGSESGAAGRIDLMVRLHCAGALFVPERDADADGEDYGLAVALAAACERGGTLELDLPRIAALAPLPPWRRAASPRRHRRTAMVVNVPANGAVAAEAVATIAGALGGRMGDIELRVQIDSSDPAYREVEAAVAADPRARIAGSSLGEDLDVPYQVVVPPVAALDERTLADLHELATAEGAGACHVTVPGASPQEAMIQLFETGAWRRARRLAGADAPTDAVAGKVAGERWLSGVEVSVRRHGVEEPQVTEHGPLAAATDPDHERSAHLRFRERAGELNERADSLARRTLSERLRARRERQAAERAEAKLR